MNARHKHDMPWRWRESTTLVGTSGCAALQHMNPINREEFQPVTVGACVSMGFGARPPPF